MRGYLILELDVLEDSDEPTFGRVLDGVRAALDDATIANVSHVHAALGADGLRESVRFLLSEERS